jgi:protein-S-isoprenylcysteine O-methyltransferase Ste14
MQMHDIALALLGAYVTVTFGLRSYLQYRRTGSAGLAGLRGRPGSLQWWASVAIVTSFAGMAATPILALIDVVPARVELARHAVGVAGVALFAVGFVATFAAQVAMGTSWRIGVQESEVTKLVVRGPFAIVRNPIFSAMLVTAAGLVLMVPSVVAIASFAIMVVALELQVRVVEEPYLRRTHGAAYEAYAARVGRFVPWVGRS